MLADQGNAMGTVARAVSNAQQDDVRPLPFLFQKTHIIREQPHPFAKRTYNTGTVPYLRNAQIVTTLQP